MPIREVETKSLYRERLGGKVRDEVLRSPGQSSKGRSREYGRVSTLRSGLLDPSPLTMSV